MVLVEGVKSFRCVGDGCEDEMRARPIHTPLNLVKKETFYRGLLSFRGVYTTLVNLYNFTRFRGVSIARRRAR